MYEKNSDAISKLYFFNLNYRYGSLIDLLIIIFIFAIVLRPDGPILFVVKKYAKTTKGCSFLWIPPLPGAAGEGARKRRALQIACYLCADLLADSGPQ